MTTLPLPLSKTGKLLAAFLLCHFCALPAARAYDWIIGGNSGTTALPTGGNTTNGSNLIKDGDRIILYCDPATGGPINSGNPVNNALINYQSGVVGANVPSFTIQSGLGAGDPLWDGTWFTLTNAKTAPASATNAIASFNGNSTITLINVIFANNWTTTGNGAAILFGQGSAQPTDVTTVTGTAIFRNNGGTGSGMLGGAIHSAAGVFTLSGSFVFDSNFSGRGGAVNTAATAGNNYISGDILFVSNTSQSQGGAFNFQQFQTATSFFSGNIQFIGNKANAGGAFSSNIDLNATASQGWVVFSGTTLFRDNQAVNNGGAIQQGGQGLVIGGNTTFEGNKAGALGGAIWIYNNKTGAQVDGGVTVQLNADTGDIIFRDNLQNMGSDFSLPGERNAIAFYSGIYNTGGTTTLTLNAVDGHTIRFYDPISVSDTADNGAQQSWVNVTQTGNGTVLYDTYQSIITHTTTIQSGTMLLTNGAIYGASNASGYFRIEAGAVVSAAGSNGAVQAAVLDFADGARVNVSGGGTLSLLASAFSGTGLQIHGNGTIETGGLPIPASLVSPGSIASDTPGASLPANSAQTLVFGASAPLQLVEGGTLAFDMFGGTTSDRLEVDTLLFTPGSAFINLSGLSGAYAILATNNTAITAGDFTILVNGYVPTARYSVTPAITANGLAGSELTVTYGAKNINVAWTGAASGGIWANTQGANSNWTNGDTVNPPELFFMNGDGVTFDDTATAKNVSVAAGGVIATSMTVSVTAGNNYTFAGSGGIIVSDTYAAIGADVAPDGKLTKEGGGALNFANGSATAGNTFEAGIEISGGTIGFTRGNQLGDGGNGIHFTGDAALRANATGTLSNTIIVDAGKTAALNVAASNNTLTYAGLLNLDTTGTLAKTGAGVLRLTAGNSANTGKTALNEGTLLLGGATASLGGDIDIASGAILAGSGTATGNVNAGPGAIIAPGATSAASPVTLNINNLNLDSSILRFNLFSSGSNDRINLAGVLTKTGASIIDLGFFQSGTFNLGNLADLAGTTVTINGNIQAAGARQTALVDTENGVDLLLKTTADISRILRWTGTTSATWTPSDENWSDGGIIQLFAGGDRVIFDDTAPAASPRDISIAGSGLYVADMYVQGTSSYSFAGAGITADPDSIVSGTVLSAADGTGKLYKAGSGTLAFTNIANTFTGGIEIAGGAITFTDAGQINDGGSGIHFTGNAALANAGVASQTLASDITVAAGVTGTLDTGANNMTLTGALAAAGGSGTLAKTGAGQLTLTNDNTSANAANLTLGINEGSLLLDNAAFSGTVDLAANTLFTAAGSIGSVRAGANSTVQIADDALDVGSFQLAGNSTLKGAGVLTGAAMLNGTVTADIMTGLMVINSSINGSGGFLKTGAGTLEISGVAALGNTGTSQLDQGALRITGVSGATYVSLLPISGNTYSVSGSTVVIPGNTYNVLGSEIVVPSSTFMLTGTDLSFVIPDSAYTVSGTTVIIRGGTATISADLTHVTVPESDIALPTNTASLVKQDYVLNGGTLSLNGSGVFTEAAANNWAGLHFIQGDNAANSTITGVAEIIHVGSGTFAPAIQGGIITVVHAGNDTAVLGNAANNFTGLVRIDSGTLQVTSPAGLGALGTGNTAKVVLNGGALQMSATLNTTRSLEMRADATVIVDDGLGVQWNAVNRPATATAADFNAILTKAGSGTLAINAALQASGLVVAEGRYIAISGSTGMPSNSGTIAVHAGAAFELAATGTAQSNPIGSYAGQPFSILNNTGTITSPFIDSGTLEVIGNKYAFTSANNTVANINISGTTAALAIVNGDPSLNFGSNSRISVNNGAQLVLASVNQNVGNVTLNDGAALGFLMNGRWVASQTYAPGATIPAHMDDRGMSIPATGVGETTVVPAHFETNGQGFKTATLASLASTGTGNTLYFNTNLELGRADRLTITGETTGDFAVGITNFGNIPEKYHGSIELINAPAGSDATFNPLTPTIDIELYSYAVSTVAGGGGVSVILSGTGAMSNSASLINSMAGALPLGWFAELDSVTRRMGELRMETRDGEGGLGTWVRGYGQQLEFNSKVNRAPFHERQFVVEGGVDYKFGGTSHNIYAGAFFGYGESQRDYNIAGDGSSESVFGGLYQTVSTKNGWYLDGVLKLNGFKNKFTAISPTGEGMSADYHNWAVGGSLEFGKYCALPHGWYVEPQIQGMLTVIMDSYYATSSGMQVELRSGTTTQGRAGFKFGRIIETGRNGLLHIYVKGSAVAQWTTNGQIYVLTPHGQSRRYTPTIKGDRLEGGAGIAWRAGRMQYYFDFETADADYYIKPWGVNFGIRRNW